MSQQPTPPVPPPPQSQVQWSVVVAGMLVAIVVMLGIVGLVLVANTPSSAVGVVDAAVMQPLLSLSHPDAGGDWCTIEAAHHASLHDRGSVTRPMGHLELMLIALRAANGGAASVQEVGWSVMGRSGDVCGVKYTYLLHGSPREVVFGLFQRPALHLVPVNDQACDFADWGDGLIDASSGVSHGNERETRRWADRSTARIHYARRMRNGRDQMQGIEDVYVGSPDETALVLEAMDCHTPQANVMSENAAAVRELRALGFTKVLCRSPRGQVETPLTRRR